jgi:hypothetical protein
MLASLKKYFPGKVDCPVESYGKLPCYKDYISVIATAGAAQWRSWLLENFQGENMPPDGVWPFIYQFRKNADPVVGLIQASSDGLREFPFTLFVVCGKGSGRGGLCSRPMALSIWRDLEILRQQLIEARDIQEFYARFTGKRVSLAVKQSKSVEGEEQEFSCSGEGDWPHMLVAGTWDAGILHLIKEGRTTHQDFFLNWQRLIVRI